jgi:hypothetical protein
MLIGGWCWDVGWAGRDPEKAAEATAGLCRLGGSLCGPRANAGIELVQDDEVGAARDSPYGRNAKVSGGSDELLGSRLAPEMDK